MTSTILVADDDRAIRMVLNQALIRLGHDVRMTGNAATLWRWVADGDGDLVITDVIMPDENGLDLIPRIKKIRPELRIIVMSAQNTLLTAVKATERGAFEYLPKPFDLRELVSVVERALTSPHDAPVNGFEDDIEEQLPLIGRSPAMQEIYRVIARLMGTDLTVTIMGESGTGKELVARALHNYGKRRNGPFVPINMAAIPRELIESELFGHEKWRLRRRHRAQHGPVRAGAGRNPVSRRDRRYAARSANAAASRVTGRRILPRSAGVCRSGAVTVRVIAATHHDLRQLIRQGLFREDLFYRLNVAPISSCRRCASVWPTYQRWSSISQRLQFAKACRRSGSTRPRWSGCGPIAGPATCENSKI